MIGDVKLATKLMFIFLLKQQNGQQGSMHCHVMQTEIRVMWKEGRVYTGGACGVMENGRVLIFCIMIAR